MSKPLSAIIEADVILVPGEDGSTGNVTGGLRLARYVLVSGSMKHGRFDLGQSREQLLVSDQCVARLQMARGH